MSEPISVAKVEQAIKEAAWDGNLSGGLQDKLLAFVTDYRRLQAENAELVRQRNLVEETLTRVETERLALARRVQELEDTVRDLLGKPVLR